MVTGDNRQIIPADEVYTATDDTILCIIRDLVDPQCKKRCLHLSASMTVADMVLEVATRCGYVPNTISVHYEKSASPGQDGEEVILDPTSLQSLGNLCSDEICKHNFTICESEDHLPQKVQPEESSSGCPILPVQESFGPVSSSPEDCEIKDSNSCQASAGYGCEIKDDNQSSSVDHNYSYLSQLKSETGFVGLVNQAMTCYLNSLLQTLFMTPEFRNAVYRWEFTGTEEEAVKSIPYQLQKLFLTLQTSNKRATETTDLTRSFGWDSSEVWHQHDVQELCRVMFDALEQNWKETDQANLINHLYQGKLKDYVKCLECSYESARIDAYLDIPLVIRPFGASQAYGSVEEGLKAFVQPEILAGSNQYFCEKCGKKCDAHKGLKFVSFPYLLTLQLKRFDFDYNTMHRIKLNDRMTFPEVLNINHMIEESGCTISQSQVSVTNSEQQISHLDCDDQRVPDSVLDIEIEDEEILSGNPLKAHVGSIDYIGHGDTLLTDRETVANIHDTKEWESKRPYMYELFSIMVHSGSAAGGHYYAYIKSFKDNQWYSFNDQHVSKITYDDICKTYGGSSANRSYYSASYTSSTNAYMLMYRRIDAEKNAEFVSPEDFPAHMKRQLEELKTKEEAERKQREIDKCTCKIKLFCYYPATQIKMENKLEVHKDKTLKETTEIAYSLFELESVVPLDCCRLVKYDEYCDALEKSFENEDNTAIGKLLGGVKSTYTFDLLLETRRPDQTFQEYKPGGVTIKVLVVDLESEIIHPPITVHACHSNTVAELKELISQTLDVPVTHMRCVPERYHSDLRLLGTPGETLKSEGLFRSNKVFVEYSGTEDPNGNFPESKFYKILDRYQNTIRIFMNIPSKAEVQEYVTLSSHYSSAKRHSYHSNNDGCLVSPAENVPQSEANMVPLRGGQYFITHEKHNVNSTVFPDDYVGADGAAGPQEPRVVETTKHVTSPNNAATTSGTCQKSMELLKLQSASNGMCYRSENGNIVSQVTDDGQDYSSGTVISPLLSPAVEGVRTVSPLAPSCCSSSSTNSQEMNSELSLATNFNTSITDMHSLQPLNDLVALVDLIGNEYMEPGAGNGNERGRRGGDGEIMREDHLHSVDVTDYLQQNASGQEKKESDEIWDADGSERDLDDEEYRRYFQATENVDGLNQRTLTVNVDKRITLGALKKELEPYIGLSSENFKVFRVYSNNQEFESTQLLENLSFLEDGKLNIKLGRALRPGEYRVKVYQLLVNDPEPCKFLIETIFAKKMSVLESKKQILAEIKEQCNLDIPLSRCRLRKKTWKNAGTVYLDNQLYEEDITIYANWEVFLEVLEGPEQVKSTSQLSLFVRRWRTSTYKLEPFQEVILSQQTTEHLKEKLHELSGIPTENIEFAKARGTFPCDIPVLSIQTELDWNPQITSLSTWPLSICDDGSVIFYRDKTEELMELSKEKKEELSQKENNRVSHLINRISNSPRKERALKIYTDDSRSSSNRAAFSSSSLSPPSTAATITTTTATTTMSSSMPQPPTPSASAVALAAAGAASALD